MEVGTGTTGVVMTFDHPRNQPQLGFFDDSSSWRNFNISGAPHRCDLAIGDDHYRVIDHPVIAIHGDDLAHTESVHLCRCKQIAGRGDDE